MKIKDAVYVYRLFSGERLQWHGRYHAHGASEFEVHVFLKGIGGDTLLALMQAVGTHELTPVCEMAPGVVLTSFVYGGRVRYILVKSGGFGKPDLLCCLADRIGAGREEKA